MLRASLKTVPKPAPYVRLDSPDKKHQPHKPPQTSPNCPDCSDRPKLSLYMGRISGYSDMSVTSDPTCRSYPNPTKSTPPGLHSSSSPPLFCPTHALPILRHSEHHWPPDLLAVPGPAPTRSTVAAPDTVTAPDAIPVRPSPSSRRRHAPRTPHVRRNVRTDF